MNGLKNGIEVDNWIVLEEIELKRRQIIIKKTTKYQVKNSSKIANKYYH